MLQAIIRARPYQAHLLPLVDTSQQQAVATHARVAQQTTKQKWRQQKRNDPPGKPTRAGFRIAIVSPPHGSHLATLS
jgi:hypothetical protein